MTLAAVVLLLVEVPGQSTLEPDIFAPFHDRAYHGWPLTYLKREPIELGAPLFVWRLSPWRLTEGVVEFDTLALAVDIAAALALLAVAAFLFEAWRRRRASVFQLHLRDLILLTALVGGGTGWIAFVHAEYRQERDVLRSIEETKDKRISWDGLGQSFAPWQCTWQKGGPTWLRELCGDRVFLWRYHRPTVHDSFPGAARLFTAFDRVVGIQVSDADLQHAVKLRHLRLVWLSGLTTNEQLKLLEQCPQLTVLDCTRLQFDNEGDGNQNVEIPNMPRLHALNLSKLPFRGAGLQHLKSIEVLGLAETDVDDDGLAKLASLRHIKWLWLSETRITNDGLRHVAGLTELQELTLDGTAVDDAGLHQLANLHELRSLTFSNNRITDQSIPILKRFKKLKYLEITFSEVSDAGLQELRRALPDCKFRHSRPTFD